MRLLHTSDWHLGHTLHDLPREREHARFFEWLLGVIGREKVDALLVTGDVFETANPTAEAQSLYYEFLARARRKHPRLAVVVIGGNHDSAGRLDAPHPVLRALEVHVVGGLPRLAPSAGGGLDYDRLLVPLPDATGAVGAWVAAVPYLRPSDLPVIEDPAVLDPLIEGVREVYRAVLKAAKARRRRGQAMIALGHCYMAGTQLSEQSERKVLGGNQHALPADLFSEEWTYVGLGHLHLAQQVAGRRVYYAGSPMPLSLAEGEYPHQVVLAEIEGSDLVSVTAIRVPRFRPILRLPTDGPRPLEEVLPQLRSLPAMPETTGSEADDKRPYLEVRVLIDKPQPSLRAKVEEALGGRAVQLVRIAQESTGGGLALGDARPQARLKDLEPEEVFRERYRRAHQGEPSDELLAAFHELLEEVRRRHDDAPDAVSVSSSPPGSSIPSDSPGSPGSSISSSSSSSATSSGSSGSSGSPGSSGSSGSPGSSSTPMLPGIG